ncbi:sensor histidine kinase [Marinospirillum sp.]|uniref:sensor histidine kinase n=1 Tax=Marinospirillum sp. TaxID=2183934 RepID=UPI00287079AB|nr:sensor histidine kinase [Marinospirillum sp.]MDR9467947.1 sensor histidine kinase [Marinospirillum sp.]
MLTVCFAQVAGASVLELNPGQQETWSLTGFLSAGPQESEKRPAELLEDSSLFTPLSGMPAWGFSSQTHWLRLTLESNFTDRHLWLLEVDPVFTDHLTLYWEDAQGQLQKLKAGDLVQASERPFNLPQQVFPLEIKPGEQKTFLLSIAGTNPLFADLSLWVPEAFIESVQHRHFYMSAYLAVLALMLLLGVIYSGLLQDKTYAFYTLYVMTQLAFQLAHSGYLGWLVNIPWPRFPDLLASASVSLSLAFFALLFSRLTRMRQDFPQLARYYLLTAWLVAATGLTFVFLDRYILVSSWIQLYILMLTAFAVIFSIYRLVTGETRLGSAYLLIFGVLALGVVLRILREQSFLPNNFWTENAMYLGTLVHLLAMQFMIVLSINQSRQANKEELEKGVQQRTAELQERNHQLLASHQENLALQADLHKSLEKESQTRQAQQDFLRMVSNEFRTPLTVIDGALTLLNMQQDAEAITRASWLERIRGAQQRLVSLVDTSLWDQRLADDDWQPSRIQLDLLPWMLQLTENLRRMYNDRNLAFQPQASCQLEVDPEMLQMLLQSLVDTLVTHLPPEVEITLGLQLEQEKLLIQVTTPGKGLLPELVDSMQTRYGKSQNRKSGSGLYLAGAAARKLGGVLEYTLLPQGASFVVTLPIKTNKKVA